MRTQTEIDNLENLVICALLASLACLFGLVPVGGPRADQDKTFESWGESQVVQADELARELSETKALRPVILYVGFLTLFSGGPHSRLHVSRHCFHQSGSRRVEEMG